MHVSAGELFFGSCVIIFSVSMLFSRLKLAYIVTLAGLSQPAFSVWLVVLPLTLILHSLALINLKTSSFFPSVHPLSSVKIAISIQY